MYSSTRIVSHGETNQLKMYELVLILSQRTGMRSQTTIHRVKVEQGRLGITIPTYQAACNGKESLRVTMNHGKAVTNRSKSAIAAVAIQAVHTISINPRVVASRV